MPWYIELYASNIETESHPCTRMIETPMEVQHIHGSCVFLYNKFIDIGVDFLEDPIVFSSVPGLRQLRFHWL